MKRAEAGEEVGIGPYDVYSRKLVVAGDYLVTPAGSAYLIKRARRVSPRNKLPEGVRVRYMLRCVKLGGRGDIPDTADTIVHDLIWYPRKRAGP